MTQTEWNRERDKMAEELKKAERTEKVWTGIILVVLFGFLVSLLIFG